MCNELNLEWGEIAELELEEEQSSNKLDMDTEREKNCEVLQEERSPTQVLTSPVSVVEKQNANCKEQLVITLTGDVESVLNNPDVQKALLVLVQKASKDASLTIDRIEKGSIKITFSGSPEGLKRLEEQIKSGNLTEVLGMPVENVQLLPSGTTDEEQDKIRLVQEIIAQGAIGRDLSCADLTGTNLEGANLEDADLNCADLRGTNLSDANLNRVSLHDAVIDEATIISDKWRLVWKIVNQASKGRDLRDADLSGANLSNADLIDADLRGADLSGADLSGADLSGVYLHDTVIDEKTRISKKWRLVWEILNQASEGRDLSRTNLSRTNLSRTNLSGTNLRRADLRFANLRRADLRFAILRRADLSGADLRFAILSNPIEDIDSTFMSTDILIRYGILLLVSLISILHAAGLISAGLISAGLISAGLISAGLISAIVLRAIRRRMARRRTNLHSADLLRAILESAIVENARFGGNLGITEDIKRDLIGRGAIFEDSPGDRSGVLTPR
ncbi:pentapeptide repeat-containing protein [Calothrix membranacea FACHB-236]|nr:pentapeptide repeat-containing protein [Calothrix membranacea FACHB-236]